MPRRNFSADPSISERRSHKRASKKHGSGHRGHQWSQLGRAKQLEHLANRVRVPKVDRRAAIL